MNDTKRPNWKQYFIGFANHAATRSTCLRRSVGAVAVKDNRIVACGYNGAPSGARHCADVGCIREREGIPSGQQHEKCRGIHAEQNCITQAAKFGVSLQGATIYSTTKPCIICAKLIIQSGIKKVVYMDSYPDEDSESLFFESEVELVKA